MRPQGILDLFHPPARRPSRAAALQARATRSRLAAVSLLLATLLASLASALPARQVSAAPFPVTVRVTIEAVDALEDLDGACGQADFYANVSVNGVSGTQGPIDDNDHITPDWVFDGNASWDAGATVPITIDLKDEDGGACLGDDDIDINPGGGVGLSITVTLGNVPCTISGDTSGTCDQAITVQGNGGGDGNASLRFNVKVINNQPDSDGDGLSDDWEQNGVSINGQFIDLPAMGADPNKPDIFIQIDWMQGSGKDQRLRATAIQMVVDAFANSPYTSPTGSVGINMHIDQGSGSNLHRGSMSTTTWGSLSRAQSITFQNNLGAVDASGNYIWTAFDNIKQTNFIPTGRSPIFHYVIAAFYQEAPPTGGTQSTASGISRNSNGAAFFDGTSDYIVSLGGFSGGVGTVQDQAGTLMHELGHNLGLGHGGNSGTNYKPNYPSIMNYMFQLRGLTIDGTVGVLDYSSGTLPQLDEDNLDEDDGLGPASDGIGTGHLCSLASASPLDRRFIADGNGPINWSCETPAVISDKVTFDANGDGVINTGATGLTDFNDWNAIKFKGGQISSLGVTVLPNVSPSEPEVLVDTVPQVEVPVVNPAPSNEAQQVSVSAAFSSEDPNPHTCTINYGDGTGALPGVVAGMSCSGTHTYADDNPSNTASDVYTVSVTVTDSTGDARSNSVKQTVNNIAPTIVEIMTNSPVPQGQLAQITINATDPGAAGDPLTYAFDCDNDGNYEVGPQAANNTACTLNPARAYTTINVRVADDDLGVTFGSVVVKQTLAMCVNNMTGALVVAGPNGSCTNGSRSLVLPLDYAAPACINPYTGELHWPSNGQCVPLQRPHIVPDDGPLYFCRSLYTGRLRVLSTPPTCNSFELAGVIPGLLD